MPDERWYPIRLHIRRLPVRTARRCRGSLLVGQPPETSLRARPSIVNLSSTRAFQSQADTESYSAAKGGITALTHALAVSLAGIARVNSISPGWIETARFHEEADVPHYTESDLLQHPSRRIGEPEDIVRATFFLCDEQNSFINGINLTVDGGMSKLMIYHNDEGWSLNK